MAPRIIKSVYSMITVKRLARFVAQLTVILRARVFILIP